jgi:hypothetical protein
MPILFNQPLGSKEVTVVEFGTGDVAMYPDMGAFNSLYLVQDVPKPVEEWKLGENLFDTGERKTTDELNGDIVQLFFGRVESVTSLIESLQRVRDNMAKNEKSYHDFSNDPNQ